MSWTIKADALTALVLSVGDDSPAIHKAFFQLWSALEDMEQGRPVVNHPQHHAARAIEAASRTLNEDREAVLSALVAPITRNEEQR